MHVLVLQHISCEPPGVYEDVLRERGATIERIEVDEGEPIPAVGSFDAIVAMGGPMGAYEGATYPWLGPELEAIATAVQAGTPFLGVCLGAQLLAAALGADVRSGPEPEVGLLPVELTSAGASDPVLGALTDGVVTLQWHGDTYDLPQGATHMARSPQYEQQAFRWGDLAYGVQFHLEVSEAMAEEWAAEPAYAEALDATLGPGSLPALLADLRSCMPEMHAAARALCHAWVDGCAKRTH